MEFPDIASQDIGKAEDDGARAIQQAKVRDLPLEKDLFESEQSLVFVTQSDVQKGIDQIHKVFEENIAESQFEIDDFTQQLHAEKTKSQWIFLRVRRSTIDVIIARATAACMLEDYKVMESHLLKAVEMATVLSQTSLYASLLKRCQYLKGVALYYQQRFQEADEAFANAGDCPAAPGISQRDAMEWTHVVKEALQASRPSSPSGPLENVAHPASPSTPRMREPPPSPFRSRELANILEEIEARESSKRPVNRPRKDAYDKARQSSGKSPLIPHNNPSMYMPNRLRRKVSFAEPISPMASMRRSASIRSALSASNPSVFAKSRYGRSRVLSNASMNEDEINAAFGGGGPYESPVANTPTSWRRRRISWGSAAIREEITVNDELAEKQWMAWELMKAQEEGMFKMDEGQFKTMMRRKYEEEMKADGEKDYERLKESARERDTVKFWMDKGRTPEDARKAQEKDKMRRGKQFKRGSS